MDTNEIINQLREENERLAKDNHQLCKERLDIIIAAREMGYSNDVEFGAVNYLIETARASVMVNQKNAELTGQRDNAWQELREIREAIGANPEESTADEVRRITAKRDALADRLKRSDFENSALKVMINRYSSEISRCEKKEAWHDNHPLVEINTVTPTQYLADHDAEVINNLAIYICDRAFKGQLSKSEVIHYASEYASQLRAKAGA